MIFFVIILLLACGLLGLIILVQNPKGGGLAGNVAGFSNQFMGVKQTTDVLEKGTWILAAASNRAKASRRISFFTCIWIIH